MRNIKSKSAWRLLSLGSLTALLVWSACGPMAAAQQDMTAQTSMVSSQVQGDDDADTDTTPAEAKPNEADVAATRPQAASAPTEDLITGAIDPYDAAAEKTKFFRAAGASGELDELKFKADAARKDGFVRKFDNWDAMLALDNDGSKTLDWFEADAYRRAIRKRVLDGFDTKRTGKLTGVERQAANAALASGRFTALAKAPASPGGAATSAPVNASKLLASLAADDHSKLSPEDLQAAMKALRDAEEKSLLQKYGKEGETKLTKEEWAQVMKDRQKPWRELTNDMKVILFDTEENGVLDEEHEKQAKEFQAKVQGVFKEMGKKVLGDQTNMSELEKKKQALEMGLVGLRIIAKINGQLDPAQTGFISEETRRKFNEDAAGAVSSYMKKFIAPYTDSDGKYGPAERQKIIEAMGKDVDARLKKVHSGPGRPSADETFKLAEDFMKDLGIIGADKETKQADQ